MIGLGVGIDYALFLITRHQEHLRDGMPMRRIDRPVRSLPPAARLCSPGGPSSSRCSSLRVAGIPLLSTLGLASAIAVVDRRARRDLPPSRLPRVARAPDHLAVAARRSCAEDKPATAACGHAGPACVRRAPGLGRASVSLASLVPLIIPRRQLEFGQEDIGATAPDTTERKAYDLITAGSGSATTGPSRWLRSSTRSPRRATSTPTSTTRRTSLQKRAREGAKAAPEGAEAARESSRSNSRSSSRPTRATAGPLRAAGRARSAAGRPAPGPAGRARAASRGSKPSSARLEAEKRAGCEAKRDNATQRRPRPLAAAGSVPLVRRAGAARGAGARARAPDRPRSTTNRSGRHASEARLDDVRERGSRCATSSHHCNSRPRSSPRRPSSCWRRPRSSSSRPTELQAPGATSFRRRGHAARARRPRKLQRRSRPSSSARPTQLQRQGNQLQAAGELRCNSRPTTSRPSSSRPSRSRNRPRNCKQQLTDMVTTGRRRPARYRPTRRRPAEWHSPARPGVVCADSAADQQDGRCRAALGRADHRARHR